MSNTRKVPKDDATLQLITSALKANFLFNGLDGKDFHKLALAMESVHVKAGDAIIVQHDKDARYFYVIAKGSVGYHIAFEGGEDAHKVGSASAGDSFGELALMYDAPRAASVIAETDCVLYRLVREVFETYVIDRAMGGNVAQFVASSPLFVDVSLNGITEIASCFKTVYVNADETIFERGDEGDAFYFVLEGTVDVLLSEEEQARRGFGMAPKVTLDSLSFFGERALISGDPRSATVVAQTRSTLLKMTAFDFSKLLPLFADNINDHAIHAAMRGSAESYNVSSESVEQIVDFAQPRTFKRNDKIVAGSRDQDSVYVILKGTVSVGSTSQGTFTLLAAPISPPGNDVHALVTSATLEALVLRREHYNNVVEPSRRSNTIRLLKRVPLLEQLRAEDFAKLSSCMIERKYALGDYIIREGDVGDSFYIVIDGKIKVTKKNPAKPNDPPSVIPTDNSGPGFFFGERALMTQEPRVANILADAPGMTTCFELSRADFERHLSDLHGVMERHYKELETKKAEHSITLGDLTVLSTLGTGQFGRVKLVEHKRIGKTYAMKCIGKKAISATKTELGHLRSEVNVMKACDSPFLLKLVKVMLDVHSFYMVLELCAGGELFSVLTASPGGRVPEKTALFYGSCVLMGLEHLHSLGAAYRDLKPENLMLDELGYIRIVDFGFAKFVRGKTYTLCGTPDYLAPEIINRVGHNRAVDVWAFGVLMYELVAGYSPFSSDDPSHGSEMYEKIIALKYSFPKQGFSKDLQDLIRKILVLKPENRLGMIKGGWETTRKHKFFAPMDFDKLRYKAVQAPYIPSIQDMRDTSNFDTYEEVEDPPPHSLPALEELL